MFQVWLLTVNLFLIWRFQLYLEFWRGHDIGFKSAHFLNFKELKIFKVIFKPSALLTAPLHWATNRCVKNFSSWKVVGSNSKDGTQMLWSTHPGIKVLYTQVNIGVLQEGFVNLNHTGLNSSDKEFKKFRKYILLFYLSRGPHI